MANSQPRPANARTLSFVQQAATGRVPLLQRLVLHRWPLLTLLLYSTYFA